MRNLLQFMVLIIGGLLILSGCASVADQPLAQVEETLSPTTIPTEPTQMTEPTEVADNEVVEAETMSNSFIFYNSHATW